MAPRLPAALPVAAAVVVLQVTSLAGCGPREPYPPPRAYSRFCAECHGADGRGDPKRVGRTPGLDLVAAEMVRTGDRPAVAERIREGHGTMPAFESKLSPVEIEALAAWTIEQLGPPEAAPDPDFQPDDGGS